MIIMLGAGSKMLPKIGFFRLWMGAEKITFRHSSVSFALRTTKLYTVVASCICRMLVSFQRPSYHGALVFGQNVFSNSNDQSFPMVRQTLTFMVSGESSCCKDSEKYRFCSMASIITLFWPLLWFCKMAKISIFPPTHTRGRWWVKMRIWGWRLECLLSCKLPHPNILYRS